VQPLGAGGMGEVWLAERDDGAFNQRVAIKSPRVGAHGPRSLERFERERALLAALEDPGIARVVDGGATHEGRPWLAMEFIEGRTIERFVAEEHSPLRARVELVRQVALALDAAHQRLIVHCDLKPSNVMVRSDGRVALLDFGIAALMGAVSEAHEVTLGTPRYSSPERLAGRAATTATDLYALAKLARELFALGDDALDADLAAVLAAASDPDPTRRMASARGFAAELQRWLERRPVESRAPSPLHRMRLFSRRQPALMALAVFTTVALSASLAAVLRALQSEQHARLQAEAAEDAALRRLEDVHNMLLALVGGVHDRIGGLVGAVPVREHLLQVADAQLQALERDLAGAHAAAPATTSLLVEVHLRVAEVLGARTLGSRGDLAGARHHVERALERIAEAERRDGAIHLPAGVRLRATVIAGDLARAAGDSAAAEACYDTVLEATDRGRERSGASDPVFARIRAAALLQRGRVRFTRGASDSGLQDLTAAESAYAALCEGERARGSQVTELARDHALAAAEVGRVLAQLGRPEEALTQWRSAGELLGALEAAAPSHSQMQRDRIELDTEHATTLAELGDSDGAERMLDDALSRARELRQRDVGNILAVRVERLVLLRRARSKAQRGDIEAARRCYAEALELTREEGPDDRRAQLDRAECLVMRAELARREGRSDGLEAEFDEGLGALPSGDAALAAGNHEVGNVRTVALVGVGMLRAAAGEHRRAVEHLSAARHELQAWTRRFGALQWPLRSEGALEYTLGCAHEALAEAAREPAERALELSAALDAFRAGLAAAQRLEREGRLQAHEAGIVGFFKADVERVEHALAQR